MVHQVVRHSSAKSRSFCLVMTVEVMVRQESDSPPDRPSLGVQEWAILFRPDGPLDDKMATKQGSKSQKLSSRVGNSPTSSTTSSSKQFPEHSIDDVTSPASSSARSKRQFYYSESVSAETERPKENVTVTVRFRPLRWN
ncbi:hypothetical protein FXO37_22747 [Capsicum annuum]|nr:hypothetical protein FXO37_22747 [Capsicum annuum]